MGGTIKNENGKFLLAFLGPGGVGDFNQVKTGKVAVKLMLCSFLSLIYLLIVVDSKML